ncbi:hypothetical protein SAMN05216436_1154 [bacterium A37T11]|nr:hypothetical protein SAMN05216436_1154 [bacterium A37T11]
MAKVNITEDQIIKYLNDRKKELTVDLDKVTKALGVLELSAKSAALSPTKVAKPVKEIPTPSKITTSKAISSKGATKSASTKALPQKETKPEVVKATTKHISAKPEPKVTQAIKSASSKSGLKTSSPIIPAPIKKEAKATSVDKSVPAKPEGSAASVSKPAPINKEIKTTPVAKAASAKKVTPPLAATLAPVKKESKAAIVKPTPAKKEAKPAVASKTENSNSPAIDEKTALTK